MAHNGPSPLVMPTVVIGGAPKCGTTSLFEWLAAHPDVCASRAKETRYLLDDSSPLERPQHFHTGGIEGYARLFEHCRHAQHILEATPDYLYQATALDVLGSLEPRPKMIFVLRRPADRVYSLYQYARNQMALIDREMRFSEFVDRVRTGGFPGKRNLNRALEYSDYATYLEPWLARFGRSDCLVYLFEELANSPRRFIKQVGHDIGLETSYYETYEFPKRNESAVVRSRLLQRIRLATAHVLPSGRAKRALRTVFECLNTRPRDPRTGDDARVLAALDREFDSSVAQLQRVTGIDLASWRTQ